MPRSFPGLLEATKLGSKAAKVGFDWPDRAGLLEKVEEECREIEAEVSVGAAPEAIEGEVWRFALHGGEPGAAFES